MPEQGESRFNWNHTDAALRRYGDTYLERRIITRDTEVRGGVYYSGESCEAIVVDPEKYPEEYERYYQEATEEASIGGNIDRSRVLGAVFTTVESNMDYSKEGVEHILEDLADEGTNKLPDGSKVELSTFMERGMGVCRHQALACATLLERFKDEGHIRGYISIESNEEHTPSDERRGHTWVRYTTYHGGRYILDVAQNYFGRLEDSDPRSQWNYLRPEEEVQENPIACARRVGNVVLTQSSS